MKFGLSLAALTGLLSLATARIEGFAVPKTIKPGDQFDAVLIGHNYIQTVAEVAAAFGVQPGQGYKGVLGTQLGSVYLGPGMFPSSVLNICTIYLDLYLYRLISVCLYTMSRLTLTNGRKIKQNREFLFPPNCPFECAQG